MQVHLAGGVEDDGWWVDDHAHAVDDESYGLLDALRGQAPLLCVVVERDANISLLDAEVQVDATKDADISGVVKAKITVSQLLTLKDSAKLNGDIITNKLSIF